MLQAAAQPTVILCFCVFLPEFWLSVQFRCRCLACLIKSGSLMTERRFLAVSLVQCCSRSILSLSSSSARCWLLRLYRLPAVFVFRQPNRTRRAKPTIFRYPLSIRKPWLAKRGLRRRNYLCAPRPIFLALFGCCRVQRRPTVRLSVKLQHTVWPLQH